MKIKPEYTALVAFVADTFSGAATVLLAFHLFRQTKETLSLWIAALCVTLGGALGALAIYLSRQSL